MLYIAADPIGFGSLGIGCWTAFGYGSEEAGPERVQIASDRISDQTQVWIRGDGSRAYA